LINIKNYTCKFDNKTILKNINLNINNHISILGANGSGKSTLAKSICNLIKFDGEININKQNIKDLKLLDKAKLLSYIPTKLEVYDTYITVYDFVLLGRFAYKSKFFEYSTKDKEITKQTLEFLKISHLQNHTLKSLSSGEQQLTLIAQALTQQSKIIIFDEPTANLDPYNSKIIAGFIKGLKEYHQIILITHDINLASFVGSDIVFIKEEKLKYYKDSFFDNANLEELYGVKFDSLVLKYD